MTRILEIFLKFEIFELEWYKIFWNKQVMNCKDKSRGYFWERKSKRSFLTKFGHFLKGKISGVKRLITQLDFYLQDIKPKSLGRLSSTSSTVQHILRTSI